MPLARPKHTEQSVQSVIAHSNGLQGGVGLTPPLRPGSHKQGPALTVRSIFSHHRSRQRAASRGLPLLTLPAVAPS